MWTNEERDLLRDGIRDNMPFDELCARLGRSPKAVRQYMFKARLPRRANTVKLNLAREVLLMRIPDPECFRPNRAFYQAVGMTQKRWWTLYFGEAQCTPEEYRALARYFNLSLKEVYDRLPLQMRIEFPDDGPAAHTEG